MNYLSARSLSFARKSVGKTQRIKTQHKCALRISGACTLTTAHLCCVLLCASLPTDFARKRD